MAENHDETPSDVARTKRRSQSSGGGPVVPCVIGTGTLGVLDAMKARVGEAVLARAFARMPPDAVAAIHAIQPAAWVPLDLSSRLIDAVALEAERDADGFFAEVVREGSLRSLNHFHRTLLRFAWDEMLIARAASAYSRIRNVGRLEASLLSPGVALAELREWPGLTERQARSLSYTMEAFFLAAGKSEVRVDTVLHPPATDGQVHGATYHCHWRS